jgi:hypothetical protein
LTADEKLIEDVKSPKLSFTKKDFCRTISSLWQTDHPRFIPGLLKVTILLTLQLFLFTGARIRAFIPAHENKTERGLRYKVKRAHQQGMALLLTFTTGYRAGSIPFFYSPLESRMESESSLVKKNRNPKYTV